MPVRYTSRQYEPFNTFEKTSSDFGLKAKEFMQSGGFLPDFDPVAG
jgi:hypothetical protein